MSVELITHHIKRGQHRIQYHEAGSGEPIVLINGLGLPGLVWEELAGQLVAHNLRVLMPDNRGTGGSGRPPLASFTMAQMADDVAAVLDHARVDRALVLGMSLGGMIAQHVALRHSQRARALFLACTTCGLPVGKIVPPSSVARLLKLFMLPSRVTLDDVQKVMAHPDSRDKIPDIMRELERRSKIAPTPVSTVFKQLWAAINHNTGHQLQHIQHLTWIATGDSDALILPENSHRMAQRLPNATLRIIPRTGHIFPFEQPGSLRSLILDWRDAVHLHEQQTSPHQTSPHRSAS